VENPRIIPKLLLCVALLAFSGCAKRTNESASTDIAQQLPFSVIYSANTNAELEPCGCRSNPLGGLQRRYNWEKSLDKATEKQHFLRIDSGDLLFETTPIPPYLATQSKQKAKALVQAYEILGMEYFTPGELDFALGTDALLSLLKTASFTTISSNIFSIKTSAPLFKPFVIVEKNFKKIAIFALIDPNLSLPDNLKVTEPASAAKKTLKDIFALKPDYVILLSHLGLEFDRKLASEIEGIDLIFGSHTQSFLTTPERVGKTLIFHPSLRSQHIGLYDGQENTFFEMNESWNSPKKKLNLMDAHIEKSKKNIAILNSHLDAQLFSDGPRTQESADKIQTFPKCIQCHTPQYDFVKNTKHFQAFQTLVKARQSRNLDCLRCHTVGQGQSTGYRTVKELVQDLNGRAIQAESFAQSLPKMRAQDLKKISKAFIQVQCENCHGAAGNHPVIEAESRLSGKVASATCLTCHTAERAPKWYRNGKPDNALIAEKIKEMSCPAK